MLEKSRRQVAISADYHHVTPRYCTEEPAHGNARPTQPGSHMIFCMPTMWQCYNGPPYPGTWTSWDEFGRGVRHHQQTPCNISYLTVCNTTEQQHKFAVGICVCLCIKAQDNHTRYWQSFWWLRYLPDLINFSVKSSMKSRENAQLSVRLEWITLVSFIVDWSSHTNSICVFIDFQYIYVMKSNTINVTKWTSYDHASWLILNTLKILFTEYHYRKGGCTCSTWDVDVAS